MRNIDTYRRGFLIIEALIALVMLGMIIVTVFPTVNFMLKRSRRTRYDAQASLLLQEGQEVAYHVFANSTNWDMYTTGVSYKPVHNGSWALIQGEDTLLETRFSRTIIIQPVCREKTSHRQAAVSECTLHPTDYEIDGTSRIARTSVSWDDISGKQTLIADLLLIKILNQN